MARHDDDMEAFMRSARTLASNPRAWGLGIYCQPESSRKRGVLSR